jgi:poly(hydroxyalkanoate) granule-associated protein
MVKKMHASAAPAAPAAKKAGKSRKASAMNGGLQDSALAKSVKDSAQHIWLAGMGAFSKVQEEGTKAFEALVKEGQSLQRKTQAVAEEKIGEVTGKMTAMAGTVQAKANQNWDKLESIFEARTAKAMSKLGVPTAKDVEALVERVDALAAAVAKLSRQGAAAKAAGSVASAATTPAKPVRRRAAAKPAATPLKAAVKAPVKRAARKAAATI